MPAKKQLYGVIAGLCAGDLDSISEAVPKLSGIIGSRRFAPADDDE
jgi:hypothetical protein